MRLAFVMRSACLVVLVACRTVPPASNEVGTTDPVAQQAGSAGELFRLTVITAADNVTRLPGADAFVIHSNGLIEQVGASDQFGRIDLRRRPFLGENPAIGVMVCHPIFYCGILRTDDMAERAEGTIALAIRVIR